MCDYLTLLVPTVLHYPWQTFHSSIFLYFRGTEGSLEVTVLLCQALMDQQQTLSSSNPFALVILHLRDFQACNVFTITSGPILFGYKMKPDQKPQ